MLGEKLILSVTSVSAPELAVEWFHNEKLIDESDTQYVLKHDKSRYELIIDSANLIDGGKWKVVGRNKLGQCESSCDVVVKIPDGFMAPTFEKTLQDVSCEEMELLTLPVKILANPPPEITWYCDDKELQHSLNHRLQFDDDTKEYSLTIVKAYKEDSGEYRCVARNVIGEAESVCSVRIEEPEDKRSKKIDESKAPKFSMHLVNPREVPEGTELILTCVVTGTPHPKITWLKDGKRLSLTDKDATYDNGVCNLTIASATLADSGSYACEAENIHGKARSETVVNITTSVEADKSAPKFVELLMDQTVQETEEILLECCFKGKPTPVITWMFEHLLVAKKCDGCSNTSDERYQRWRNSVSNKLGAVESRAMLVVEQETTDQLSNIPVFIKKIQNVTVKEAAVPSPPTFVVAPKAKFVVDESSSLTIVCDISGSSSMQVTWLKNGRPLNATDRVQMERDGLTSRLIIANVTPEDEGQYAVTAKDEHGEVTAESEVVVTPRREAAPTAVKIVKGPPSAIKGEPVVESSTKDSVSLSWSPPEDTHGSRVEDYKVEQRTPDQQNWVEVATVTRPRCTIKNLSPNTEYLFRVAARNAEGFSEGSLPVKVRTLPAGTKPLFTESPASSIAVTEDEELCIVAKFSGSPTPSVKWYKSGKEMTDGSITTESDSSVLTIAKARSGVDDAIYTCQIENEMGQASSDISVSVISSKEEVPMALPSGYHNDDKVTPTGRYELFTSSNGSQKLVCHNSNVTDAGVYRCVLTNEKGMAQTDCEVFVRGAEDQAAPVFEKNLEDITTLTGKKLVLSCRAIGHPEPDLVWTKDGERIATSRRVRLEFDDKGLSELHIHDCTAQDAGIYLCTATNTSGVQSTQCTVTVAEVSGKDAHLVIAEEEKIMKPRFIRAPPSTLEAQEGGQFKLIAKAVGEPKPTLTWKKDGREVVRSNRPYKTYLTGDGESHLVVECVVSKTSGIFSCIAHNIHGEAETETQVFVHRGKTSLPAAEKPAFSEHLKDTGVVAGHPVTLGCKVHGVPEPELKWYYIDDAGNITCLTDDEHGWIECRGGEVAELKADCVLRNQQGTYKCVASNEHGQASSMCYLLIGDLKDERAGPPRFLRCLRDVWTPLGEEINYLSENVCELRVSQVSLRDLGSYAVEASNVHGVVRTTSSLNVGEPRHAEPPQFQQVEAPGIAVKPKVAFREEVRAFTLQKGILMCAFLPQVKKSASTVRMEMRKKGAAPVFIKGLEDMELEAGASAAVAGKLKGKHRHRHSDKGAKTARGLAASIMAGMKIDEESRRQSTDEQKQGYLAMEEIRSTIQARNEHMCRPKFIVKPRPKKVLEEFKSLRLKTAISANPTPVVHWDREGVILETGNKYSIYNDGDFYYLEVHQVSIFDQGFYNCTATNSEGISTCSSEVEVVKATEDPSAQQEKRKPKKELKAPAFIEVLPGKLKAIACEPLSIECSLSGYPAPAIRWLRNGTPLLPQTERYVMSYDGECATLKFAFVSVADEGVYTCEAKNECGETKAQVCLEIDPGESLSADGIPPLFRTEKVRSIIKANDGERVELAAELVQGSEPLQIRWVRNRVVITDSESFQYVRNGTDVRLVIADAFPEDGGEYAVEARNQFGTARCIMRLDIHSESSL
ncbi:immunoglobulin I-set domain protein [Ostertagia ostertagi]